MTLAPLNLCHQQFDNWLMTVTGLLSVESQGPVVTQKRTLNSETQALSCLKKNQCFFFL